MKSHLKFLPALLLAVGLGTLASPSMADNTDCGPMGSWERFHEQRSERMQQHQKQLHEALKLTPEQEPGWQKFVASSQPAQREERPGQVDWSKLTAPERAEKMLDLSKRRQERLAEHVAALKTFYATLTPEQQKIFDQQHPGPRQGRGGKGLRHPGGAPGARG